MPGKQRSPFVVIVLCVVTIGIYWFFWTRMAFGELAEQRGRRLPLAFWLTTLILFVASLGIAVFRFALQISEVIGDAASGAATTFSESFEESLREQYSPLGIVAIVLTVALYLAQLQYLRPANDLVHDAVQPLQISSPSTTLVIAFSLLIGVGAAVPFIGGMISIAGSVIAIVWIVQVQQALNEYWRRIPYVAAAPPSTQGMPAPIMLPPR